MKSFPRDAQNILCCFREKFENLQACSCVNGVIIGNRHCKKLFHKYAMRIFAKLFANSLIPMFILFVSNWAGQNWNFFFIKHVNLRFPRFKDSMYVVNLLDIEYRIRSYVSNLSHDLEYQGSNVSTILADHRAPGNNITYFLYRYIIT